LATQLDKKVIKNVINEDNKGILTEYNLSNRSSRGWMCKDLQDDIFGKEYYPLVAYAVDKAIKKFVLDAGSENRYFHLPDLMELLYSDEYAGEGEDDNIYWNGATLKGNKTLRNDLLRKYNERYAAKVDETDENKKKYFVKVNSTDYELANTPANMRKAYSNPKSVYRPIEDISEDIRLVQAALDNSVLFGQNLSYTSSKSDLLADAYDLKHNSDFLLYTNLFEKENEGFRQSTIGKNTPQLIYTKPKDKANNAYEFDTNTNQWVGLDGGDNKHTRELFTTSSLRAVKMNIDKVDIDRKNEQNIYNVHLVYRGENKTNPLMIPYNSMSEDLQPNANFVFTPYFVLVAAMQQLVSILNSDLDGTCSYLNIVTETYRGSKNRIVTLNKTIIKLVYAVQVKGTSWVERNCSCLPALGRLYLPLVGAPSSTIAKERIELFKVVYAQWYSQPIGEYLPANLARLIAKNTIEPADDVPIAEKETMDMETTIRESSMNMLIDVCKGYLSNANDNTYQHIMQRIGLQASTLKKDDYLSYLLSTSLELHEYGSATMQENYYARIQGLPELYEVKRGLFPEKMKKFEYYKGNTPVKRQPRVQSGGPADSNNPKPTATTGMYDSKEDVEELLGKYICRIEYLDANGVLVNKILTNNGDVIKKAYGSQKKVLSAFDRLLLFREQENSSTLPANANVCKNILRKYNLLALFDETAIKKEAEKRAQGNSKSREDNLNDIWVKDIYKCLKDLKEVEDVNHQIVTFYLEKLKDTTRTRVLKNAKRNGVDPNDTAAVEVKTMEQVKEDTRKYFGQYLRKNVSLLKKAAKPTKTPEEQEYEKQNCVWASSLFKGLPNMLYDSPREKIDVNRIRKITVWCDFNGPKPNLNNNNESNREIEK
jgi:hypothetical protein